MSLHKVLNKQGYLIKKDQIDAQTLKDIRRDLTIKPLVLESYKNMSKVVEYEVYQESPNYLFLPRFYGIDKFGMPNKDKMPMGKDININFIYDLLPHQKTGYEKTLKVLQTIGGGILVVCCGWGKTATSIKLGIVLGGQILIIVNKEVLMDQWVEAITKFTGGKAKIGIIQEDRCEVEGFDFVVAMVHSLSQKTYPASVFANFRTCILDECHHYSSEMFSKILPKITSKYMLGLSATFRRNDGTINVLNHYLGNICHIEKRSGSNRILVKRVKLSSESPHYELLKMPNGTKNTSSMITNLAKYEVRTHLIGECIRQLMTEDRKILLLSDRRKHLEQIHDYLQISDIVNIHGQKITYGYYRGNQGSNKKAHKLMLQKSAKCDIVLGTYSIASEGLDIPDLNALIMATPCADVEQSVGRILRKYHHNIHPLVIDLVDRLGNFPKQASTRAKLYKSEDYEIHDMKMTLTDQISDLDPLLPQLRHYLADVTFKHESTIDMEDSDDNDNDLRDHDRLPTGQCLLDDEPQSTIIPPVVTKTTRKVKSIGKCLL